MSTQVYTGILQFEIPIGGWGRPLTTAERSKLFRYGLPCSEEHIVVRIDVNSPGLGRLYEPNDSPEQHHPLEVVVS